MALDPKDRDRLEKLLNMLGSPVDGEIANAGRMIQKMATRYNVTPADLCLNNRIGSPAPEPEQRRNSQQQSRRGHSWQYAPDGRTWDEVFRERDEDAKRAQDRIRREQERRDAEKARQRRQEEAAAKSARKAKAFPREYFGLLGRLKALYEDNFDDLEAWHLDFIEIVLRDCKADREMTIRQREMAKAVLKYNEDAEPLV